MHWCLYYALAVWLETQFCPDPIQIHKHTDYEARCTSGIPVPGRPKQEDQEYEAME